MNKKEAVKKLVEEFNNVPAEWVNSIAGDNGDYVNLGMWGTCFIVDDFVATEVDTRTMYADVEELKQNINNRDVDYEKIQKAIKDDDYGVLEEYINEQMGGENCILDKDGETTNMYLHEVQDEFIISVNGAGFDFYSGVWDVLYDALGLQWHNQNRKVDITLGELMESDNQTIARNATSILKQLQKK